MKNATTLKSIFTCLCLALAVSLGTAQAQTDVKFTEPAKVYTYVNEMPQYQGGQAALMKFLSENINYPEAAKASGSEGMAVASFVVKEDGNLSDFEMKRSAGTDLDKEVIRVLKLTSGKWTAGKQDGKAVKVRMVLPVQFASPGKE